MEFNNPSLISVRTDGRASPNQYAPSTFFKVGGIKWIHKRSIALERSVKNTGGLNHVLPLALMQITIHMKK